MKRILAPMLAGVLGVVLGEALSAADTPGTVTFNVQLANANGNYAPKHVVAVWVKDSAGKYVKCLWKNGSGWSGEGTSHLTQLQAARGTSTVLDGTSTATITSYNPFTVTWDCRNATRTALMPDGVYHFFVETTDKNASGPYSGSLDWVKGPAVFTTNYPNQTYLKNLSLTFTPATPVHDIALLRISPGAAIPNSTVDVQVVVTNKGDYAESFAVTLTDDTDARAIGTNLVAGLLAAADASVTFPWSTTNATLGTHSLRAVAGPVAGETSTADNTATVLSRVVPMMTTNIYLTKGNPWRYNDTGKDLGTAWRQPHYDDSGWATGRGPLGYADPPINTTLNYGSDASAKRLTSYFRQTFNVPTPSLPASLLMSLRRDDGVVIYHNGMEIYRFNLANYPAPIHSTNRALVAVAGTDETNYFAAELPATNAVFGVNTIAVEVHQQSPSSSDLSFDLELWGAVPPIVETNMFVAKGSAWRYHDQGIDLTDTPWKAPEYYDRVWSSGRAPLGYGQTNLNTTLSYGANADAKYPTYYFRTEFHADALPVSLTLNARRDAGVIFYLNGSELARLNAPAGPVTFSDYFPGFTVSGTDQYATFTTNAAPTNMVLGRNVLAAEVHQATANGPDLALEVEMVGSYPTFERVHAVDALAVAAPAEALVGDRVPTLITVTNRGNVTETALVALQDADSGEILGTRTVSGLVPGGVASVQIDCATLGATAGRHRLQAYTVVSGVTNVAGVAMAPLNLSGSGFGLKPATVIGSVGGYCSAAAASSSLLVVAAGATLEVWDRSNPSVPARIGSVRLPGSIEDMVVSGRFGFVACGSDGVQFVDLSVPSAPRHANTYDTSGHASGLAVNAGHLYVADGVSGLRIVNISLPDAPSLAGAYYTTGPARAVAVVDTTAYLLDAHTGLLILDIANPAAPTLLGAYPGVDAGQDLAVAGEHAYVVDANNHFYVVNVADPAAPVLANAAKTFLLPNLVAQSIALSGTTAYVPTGAGGLAILDVAAPGAPGLVGTMATPGQAVAAAVAGTTLYLADGFHGLQVYDVTTAANPVLQTDWPTSIRACDVALNGNLALVAAGEGGLRIYDVANPAAPAWLGWFAGALNARCVAVSGSTAYVGDGQYGLKIVTVATPASPALLGAWSDTGLSSIRNLGVSGPHVVASDGRHVCLFDVSTPDKPTLSASYSAPAFALDMAVSAGRAYLACGDAGFAILDLGAATLVLRSLTDTPGLARGIAVSGHTAYVADGAHGWLVFNVLDPAAPSLVRAHSAPGAVSTVAVSGVLATLSLGANAAVTMDVTTPLTPVTAGTFVGLANALRVCAAGGQIYRSEDAAGLAVLSTRGTPLVLQITPPAGGLAEIGLRWLSQPGRTYAVYRSSDMALGGAGFSLVQGGIPATPPVNSVSVDHTGTVAFYLISEQ